MQVVCFSVIELFWILTLQVMTLTRITLQVMRLTGIIIVMIIITKILVKKITNFIIHQDRSARN
jgi:hypothetical protein